MKIVFGYGSKIKSNKSVIYKLLKCKQAPRIICKMQEKILHVDVHVLFNIKNGTRIFNCDYKTVITLMMLIKEKLQNILKIWIKIKS